MSVGEIEVLLFPMAHGGERERADVAKVNAFPFCSRRARRARHTAAEEAAAAAHKMRGTHRCRPANSMEQDSFDSLDDQGRASTHKLDQSD